MTKLCSFTLDEATIFRLEELIKWSGPKPNKSRVFRELIDAEYTRLMGIKNVSA